MDEANRAPGFDALDQLLARADADYADIRYEVKRETAISYSGRELTGLSASSADGYVLRVLKDGGLATVAFTKPADAEKALATATANAAIIGRAAKEPGRLLSIGGAWFPCKVSHYGGRLAVTAAQKVEGGTSGSPIVNDDGAAIGMVVCSSEGAGIAFPNPRLTYDLPGWLMKELLHPASPDVAE